MEYRKTNIITRRNCPETNSSSSHSFVLVDDVFKLSDLESDSQTLIPDSSGIITIDGITDDLDGCRVVNDSKSKAYYAIASALINFGKSRGKALLGIIKEIIMELTGAKEVNITSCSSFSIDHQSMSTLKDVLLDGKDIIKEFIFNPRVYLYLLWDSEDCMNNQIFSASPGYFKYELSVKVPKITPLFGGSEKVDEIDFIRLCREYPTIEDLYDLFETAFEDNGLTIYSESKKALIDDPRKTKSFWWNPKRSESMGNEDYYEFLGFSGLNSEMSMVFLRSTLWSRLSDTLKYKYNNFNFRSEDEKEFGITLKELEWYSKSLKDSTESGCVFYFLKNLYTLMTEDELKLLIQDPSEIISFPIKIYSRETGYEF